jgi:hypothetical protein
MVHCVAIAVFNTSKQTENRHIKRPQLFQLPRLCRYDNSTTLGERKLLLPPGTQALSGGMKKGSGVQNDH